MKIRAWYLFLCLLCSPAAFSQSDIFSFAVKGGVSLGSYEAGLNWVYLEEIKRRHFRLNTFTGASAGSINALMSAIRYCEQDSAPEIETNIFRQTWDIGMEDLMGKKDNKSSPEYKDFIDDLEQNISLPSDNIIGNDRGGLFNRGGLLKSLKHIYQNIQNGKFKEGCEVKVGISVTKFVPDSFLVNGISIKNQRYIIPFIVRVKDQKLIFINTPYFNSDPQDIDSVNGIDHFIFLPQGETGISVFDIFRASIASSAFPVAFPPVRLNYCVAASKVDVNSGIACPAGYVAREDLFIDGGSLDNAPIGTAQRLSQAFSCSKNRNEDCLIRSGDKFNLIYVNPGRMRERQLARTSQNIPHYQGDSIVGMIDYLSLAGHIMDYGMSAELYRSLATQRNDNQVRLLSSSRFYPLTGDYIEHFGAFFDSAYRRFDYYAGVYDGVINVANNFCLDKPDPETCRAEESKNILTTLNIKKENDSAAYLMFVLQASREFYNHKDDDNWRWLYDEYSRLTVDIDKKRKENSEQGKVIDIFYALDKRICVSPKSCDHQIEPPDFKGFLGALTETKRYNENTRNMVKSPQNWNHAILDDMLKRTIAVEEMKLTQLKDAEEMIDKKDRKQNDELAENRNTQQILVNSLQIVSLYGQSFFKKNSRGYWPASTLEDTCLSRDWTWKCLIPDEFGMHTDNVGGYISYRLQFPSMFRDQSIDIGIDPLHFALNTDDYGSLEALYRFENSNVFITSTGLGMKFYKTIGEKDRYVDTQYFGLVAKVGFFSDKIKVTAAYRLFDSDFSSLARRNYRELASGDINYRQRVELTIGINDVRGITNILFW